MLSDELNVWKTVALAMIKRAKETSPGNPPLADVQVALAHFAIEIAKATAEQYGTK